MKMTYNFGLLKDLNVGFKFKHNGENLNVCGILKKGKKIGDNIKFTFENFVFEVNEMKFITMVVQKEKDIIWFVEQPDRTLISGLIGFSMFDTYGFPMEITKEILENDGFSLDVKGYEIIKELQKEKTKNTFKSESAFK